MNLRLIRRNLPSFLPSKCGAPALARVCGRFGRKRPFEIYRHLSTPATVADTIDARRCRSGRRPRSAGIEHLKLLSGLTFSPIFLPSRCHTAVQLKVAIEIDRSRTDLGEHSGRALHPRTVLTAHCEIGRQCVRSRGSQTASVSITSMKRSALNPSGYRVQADGLATSSGDWSAT